MLEMQDHVREATENLPELSKDNHSENIEIPSFL